MADRRVKQRRTNVNPKSGVNQFIDFLDIDLRGASRGRRESDAIHTARDMSKRIVGKLKKKGVLGIGLALGGAMSAAKDAYTKAEEKK